MSIPIPDHIRQAAAKVRTRMPRETVERALAMYDAGWAPARIQRETFVSTAALHAWRYAADIPTNGSNGQDKMLDPAEAQRTAELYNSGLTIEQVGAMIGLTETGVIHRLDAAGVRRRPTGYAPGSLGPRLPDGFITTVEASKRVPLSHVTIHRRCRDGHVPGARMFDVDGPGPGRIWGIPVDSLATLQRKRAPRPVHRRDELAERRASRTNSGASLPTANLAAWMAENTVSAVALARGNENVERMLYRAVAGEQQTVDLDMADRMFLERGERLEDVWVDFESALAEGERLKVAADAARLAAAAKANRARYAARDDTHAEDRAA